MIRVELHTHTADDPVDRIPYTSEALIDRAAALGYQALAITLHEHQLEVRELSRYAADRGIVLIPGVERSIEGRHVLLLNFKSGADELNTFDDLARLRRHQQGLVVAPHPFFPSMSSLWGRLDQHADLFDAVEFNAMFTGQVNFNRQAERWATEHGKPLVGNCDVHRLRQLGSTYSIVDAAPGADADAICDAIAAGRVSVKSTPLTWAEVGMVFPEIVVAGLVQRIRPRASGATRVPHPSFD